MCMYIQNICMCSVYICIGCTCTYVYVYTEHLYLSVCIFFRAYHSYILVCVCFTVILILCLHWYIIKPCCASTLLEPYSIYRAGTRLHWLQKKRLTTAIIIIIGSRLGVTCARVRSVHVHMLMCTNKSECSKNGQ